jgi:hypothetical protein
MVDKMKELKIHDIVEIKHLVMHGNMMTETWKPGIIFDIRSREIHVKLFKPINEKDFLVIHKKDYGTNLRLSHNEKEGYG